MVLFEWKQGNKETLPENHENVKLVATLLFCYDSFRRQIFWKYCDDHKIYTALPRQKGVMTIFFKTHFLT